MSPFGAIFLSYASEDAIDARRICGALRAAGLEVWFDQSELRSGDAWDALIRKQIKECALFVPIISNNSQQREEGYFRLEWKLAVDRSHLMADNKAFLFPLILGDVAETEALVPDKFRERQWTRLDDDATTTAFAQRLFNVMSGSGVSNKIVPTTAQSVGTAQSILEASTQAHTPSIAVLAFANRSADPDDEYFSDGLADELLNVLARIKGLRVAARTSAFSFKGKQTTIAEIGCILNVATVLEGSVRKSGNRVRIAVQLSKVNDGFLLWGETYDRTLEDIFAVQDEITAAVVQELRAALLGSEAAKLDAALESEMHDGMRTRSANPEARRLILQARFYLQKRRPADIKRALALSEEAIAIDPQYGQAHSIAANAWYSMSIYGIGQIRDADRVREYMRRARESAVAALALDTTLAFPHIILSWVSCIGDHDRVAAMREAKLAQALAPNDAEVLRTLGHRLMEEGHFAESEAIYSRAIELDPLSVQLRLNFSMLAHWSGSPTKALHRIREALAIDENSWIAYTQLARVLDALGDHAGAVEAFAQSRTHLGEHEAARYFRQQFADGGWQGYLTALVSASPHPVPAIQIARAQIELARVDDAFATLNHLVDHFEQYTFSLKQEPGLAPLHNDPRFNLLLQRAGFTQ